MIAAGSAVLTWFAFRFRLQAKTIMPARPAKNKSPTPAPIPATAPVLIFFVAGVVVTGMIVMVGVGFWLILEVISIVGAFEVTEGFEVVGVDMIEVVEGVLEDRPTVLPMAV